jgi:aryl-alcohol dehydrogenase-like predicted oxidoreductase
MKAGHRERVSADALTAMAPLERFALAPDLTICRILNGMWQVSGANGRIEREKALGSMTAHVDAGVQFSLIDRRPEVRMAPFCRERGVHLLAYGTLCGGLLSQRYLGQPDPRGSALDTASLQKYKRMVDVWGGWTLFQELLAALNDVATRHAVDIPTLAVRWVLDRPAVAGAILGRRPRAIARARSEAVRQRG